MGEIAHETCCRESLGLELPRRLDQFIGIRSIQHHGRAGPQQSFGNRFAQSSRGPSNQGGLPLEREQVLQVLHPDTTIR